MAITLNGSVTATAKIMLCTLSADTFIGHEVIVTPLYEPIVVNGWWRIQVGKSGTFRFKKFLLWNYWAMVKLAPASNGASTK